MINLYSQDVVVVEIRRIFKSGNSLVVTLPAGMARELEIGEGSYVTLELDRVRGGVWLRPLEASGLRPSFRAMATGSRLSPEESKLRELLETHEGLLRALTEI